MFSRERLPCRFVTGQCNGLSGEVVVEEGVEFVPGDQVHAIVKIDVVGARNDHKLLRLRRGCIGGFDEVPRVGFFAMDQQDRARLNLRS